ncbi:MAG: hypothetical protein ACE5EW_06255 [Thermoplasmata archaeon]
MQSTGKKRTRYLEKLGLEETTVVHFDIPEGQPGKRWKLHRFLHGRVERRKLKGSTKLYRYPGLLHEGGFRMGQSVYMLPPELASRLIVELRDLGVRHRWWDVYTRG